MKRRLYSSNVPGSERRLSSTMKALVLAGGTGSRLRPLTHTDAKQLIPVANKPIIAYCVESIAAAGITDVEVIVGPETASGIQGYLGHGGTWGLHIHYIHQESPLGLAHCVTLAEEFLGDTPFVMCLGDNLFQQGITETVQAFRSSDADARVLLAEVPDPREFGVAAFDDQGALVGLVEKPAHPPSNMVITGLYCFGPAVFAAARSITPSQRGELEITDAIQWLLDHGHRVEWTPLQGWWKDTGRPEDILEANRLVLGDLKGLVAPTATVDGTSQLIGEVVLEDSVQVIGSTVRGPAVIGRGTRLVNAEIGPFTAIDAGCEIANSRIENSILRERTRVTDLSGPLEGSLVGRDVAITGDGSPRPLTVVLGDHSQIRLP